MPVESAVQKAALVDYLSPKNSKHDALLYHLADVEWSVFGTLTWDNWYRRLPAVNAEKLRRADFGLLKLNTCRLLNIRPKNLAYYHAMERGAGECHFHFLIARKGIERHDPATVANMMQTLWNDNLKREANRKAGLGRAKIEPFDSARQSSGVAYCLKREFDESGNQLERQDYISPKLFKHLGGVIPFNENYLFN
jgi:hypothetical protein